MSQIITPTVLTPLEVAAGRVFKAFEQAELDKLNTDAPPDFYPPYTNATYRHMCARQGFNSRSMALKEIYKPSSRYWVYTDEETDAWVAKLAYPGQRIDTGLFIPAGRFGFIYRQGSCNCGATGRSRYGWFVDANRRPPRGRIS